jgi:basic membrane protein A
MKKFISVLLGGVMALSLAACSSDTSTAAPAASSTAKSSAPASSAAAPANSEVTPAAQDEMRIVMVTDYGEITDKSFNQTTYEASKAWAEANGCDFTYKRPASDADQDREAAIEEAIEEGYNVVVLPGFAFGTVVSEVAPTYPDVKFIALDVAGATLSENAYSAVYQEELAGYMAGYAAVKLGYKKLGFLGGMAVPSVVRYGFGFVQGADAAAVELGLDDVTVNYVYGGKFFGDAGITAKMDTWYAAGTEVVFACGGSIYTSACEAAAKVNAKVIGVDVDQSAAIDGDYGEGMTVTSAMKGLTATVNTMLDVIKAGKWADFGGKEENLGIVSDDPSENYVQLPTTTQWADGFTEADYKDLVKKLHSGEIKVANGIDAMPATEKVTVTDEGSMG